MYIYNAGCIINLLPVEECKHIANICNTTYVCPISSTVHCTSHTISSLQENVCRNQTYSI